MPANKIIIGKVYRHVSGKLYRVGAVAANPQTKEEFVLFQELDGDMEVFVLPVSEFFAPVCPNDSPDTTQQMLFEPVSIHHTGKRKK